MRPACSRSSTADACITFMVLKGISIARPIPHYSLSTREPYLRATRPRTLPRQFPHPDPLHGPGGGGVFAVGRYADLRKHSAEAFDCSDRLEGRAVPQGEGAPPAAGDEEA